MKASGLLILAEVGRLPSHTSGIINESMNDNNFTNMYEVESKVEITDKERNKILEIFKQSNFPSLGITPQNDFYTTAKKSSFGGYDIQRYREEGSKFIYTEKVWEKVDGQPIRRESEHELLKSEFISKVSAFPEALKITKDREWFTANHQGRDISITIDTVKFDHSPDTRYFIEAEIRVADKNEITPTKNLITSFLKEVLQKSEITEAPGMFTMAFERI